MGFSARLYEKGDEKKLVRLLSTVFNGWPSFDIQCDPTEYWLWKYRDLPTGRSRVALVETEDQIIGCHHTAYFNIKIGSKVLTCAQAMDLGTHPDYRKMGVNTAIGDLNKAYNETGENPSNLTYWATTNPLVIKLNKRGGSPSFPYQISYLIRVRNVDLQLDKMESENRMVNKLGYKTLSLLSKIRGLFNSYNVKGINIEPIEKFDDRITTFWEKVKDEFDFVYEQSVEYLNWRFCDPRGGNYKVWLAIENNQVVGYIVDRINNQSPDYPEGFIVELLALPGRDDVLDALIKQSIEYFDKNNINIIHCWVVKENKYEKILFANEFVRSRREIGLHYNTLKDSEDVNIFRDSTPSRLHFTYGSTDWI